jgi:hypothetical protein
MSQFAKILSHKQEENWFGHSTILQKIKKKQKKTK